jgi:hypothetical protein
LAFLGATSLYMNVQQCQGLFSYPFPWLPWPYSCNCGLYHNIV